MTDWIEVNIPWQGDLFPELPEPPDLSERERKVFGFSKKEKEQEINWQELQLLEYDMRQEVNPDYELSFEETEKIVRAKMMEMYNTDTNIKAFIDFEKFEEKYDAWWEEQPEIKAWDEECNKIENEFKPDGFADRRLAKPGTLIETEDGRIMLIGNINALGGVCDDCMGISYDTIVKRYRVIWADPKKEDNNGN